MPLPGASALAVLFAYRALSPTSSHGHESHGSTQIFEVDVAIPKRPSLATLAEQHMFLFLFPPLFFYTSLISIHNLFSISLSGV